MSTAQFTSQLLSCLQLYYDIFIYPKIRHKCVGYFPSLCVEKFFISFEGSRAAAVNLVSKRSPYRFQGKAFYSYSEKSYLFPTTRSGSFSETSLLYIFLSKIPRLLAKPCFSLLEYGHVAKVSGRSGDS